ncbi:hypothetical protein ACQEV4_02795 [Streptomyces shenzhenensis]|uniref:hypothetical protein n=1 Tax=Streptomyces shenzhenensis TaxID=943815 RepID=UPI003D9493F8
MVEAAQAELLKRQREGNGVIPSDFIPPVRTDDRLLRYGYVQYRDLFNPRQLLHLSVLLEEISKLPKDEKEVAALALSNHLTTTCMLTSYAAGWRRLVPLFSLRAFRHVPRPVEVNPWLLGTGRGTYPNALRQVRAAVDFSKSPREFTKGGFISVPAVEPLAPPRVVCGSAEDLSHVPSSSVSLVLSDPPYLDNIAYSELSDFFAPWLRATEVIGSDDPEAARRTSLAAANRKAEAAADFATRLGKCFQEAARVLTANGRVVFTYQHATPIGWLGLAQALSVTPLMPVQVFPLQGDGGLGLHAHEGNSIFDAILVLRRRELPVGTRDEHKAEVNVDSELTISSVGETEALRRANRWVTKLNGDIPGVFRVPDAINLRRAFLVATSLEERFDRPEGRCRSLLESLIDVAEPSSMKTCN